MSTDNHKYKEKVSIKDIEALSDGKVTVGVNSDFEYTPKSSHVEEMRFICGEAIKYLKGYSGKRPFYAINLVNKTTKTTYIAFEYTDIKPYVEQVHWCSYFEIKQVRGKFVHKKAMESTVKSNRRAIYLLKILAELEQLNEIDRELRWEKYKKFIYNLVEEGYAV